jgi:hypothetical protein
VRYFFEIAPPAISVELLPVSHMLSRLHDVVDEVGLFRDIPADTKLYRVRAHPTHERPRSWRELGSPPPEKTTSGRMSAAGISVFYAAMNLATAKAEVAFGIEEPAKTRLTSAVWKNTRTLRIIDLSHLPSRPDFYASLRYHNENLAFLEAFVDDITKPVQHDGREHIDYVPTQIVTEYFRHRFRFFDGAPLDGIIYPSARLPKGCSLVIFADPDDLDPSHSSPLGLGSAPLLTLEEQSLRRHRVPKKRTVVSP